MIGDILIRGTIVAATLSYGVAEWLRFKRPAAWRRARLAWTAGVFLALVHAVLAFHFRHHWSHGEALVSAASQTAAVTGLRWSGGLYVNYAFLALWTADVGFWWRSPAVYRAIPSSLENARALTFLFMFSTAPSCSLTARRAGSDSPRSARRRLRGIFGSRMTEPNATTLPSPGVWPRTFYYGWVTMTVAALAMVGTLPGRTQGLGLITEPLIRDLQIDRLRFAEINLVATLIGSLFCVGIGRMVDRFGSRSILTLVSLALGTTVLVMSQTSSVALLLVLITLTRGFGQSALSVVSLAAVGKWFARRLPAAMAAYTVVMSIGFMIGFPTVGWLTSTRGWRFSWMAVGLAIAGGLAPLSWLLVRSTPESLRVPIDGEATGNPNLTPASAIDIGATLGDALRSAAFWVFALSSATYGLVASGIALFNESILAERGFDATVYYRSLVFTAVAALAGNFTAGALAAQGSLRPLLVFAMFLLACGLAALPHVAAEAHVIAYAITMGVAGGFVMVVFFSFWGRAYGRRHLGRIQGAAQALTVVASAVGPLLLAWGVQATGSYSSAFYLLAVVVMLLAIASATVRVPSLPSLSHG